MEILKGSGNVVADFGDADAETKKLKAQVAAEIIVTAVIDGLPSRGLRAM